MFYYFAKTLLAAALIVAISEISKRSAMLGAILASVPIISLLAILFLYSDTHNPIAVSKLSTGIFWLVLPSLVFFLALPALLKAKVNFPLSIALSLSVMILAYFAMLFVLRQFGLKL